MRFIINEEPVEAQADVRTSLLDFLREHLGLTDVPATAGV